MSDKKKKSQHKRSTYDKRATDPKPRVCLPTLRSNTANKVDHRGCSEYTRLALPDATPTAIHGKNETVVKVKLHNGRPYDARSAVLFFLRLFETTGWTM